ncbi:MAG TPA: alpha-amylase family glycosyl hydrolase [Gemmatimonadales bacterium]|nr:alpha-amylase family glycosyl hydrolase [Gemmatimonadales bacterium]
MKTVIRGATLVGLGVCILSACIHRAPESAIRDPSLAIEQARHPAEFWNAATVYFLLTDRFVDGDTANDHALGRAQDGAVLRSYMGGDLKGVLEKIEAGYFDSLGVNVLWLTPFVEQIRGRVDEGQGMTYAYHGYWGRDWTAVDPALGTKDDLRAVVDAAHRHHMRVLMDAVINHVGPVTPEDPPWPPDWVRSGPSCTYRSYATTVDCDLVPTLPDVRTESNAAVDLPPWLVEKWRREGRLEHEQASLDAFFARTGYPRAPRYYFIKWLTDWVREFGIDGYRMDTAKHFGESVAVELKQEANRAFADWKRAHRSQVLDSLPFFMVGEVFGWDPGQGRLYNYGDSAVDFFAHGYDGLINFAFKRDVAGSLDSVFTRYSVALHTGGALNGLSFLNYLSSHDDGEPYDLDRRDPFGAATRLLLAPGAAQIYYGDETARPLRVPGARGDANLRSLMNWGDLAATGPHGDSARAILAHWRKLGAFRNAHPSVGAGRHRTLQANPLIFSRILVTDNIDDRVVVAMDQPKGPKAVPVYGTFPNGTELVDAYSGEEGRVRGGAVAINTPFDLLLLSRVPESPNDTVVVYVENNYALPMDVLAVAAGTTFRMGVVNPGIPSRFVLRKDLLATDRLVTFVAQATAVGPQIHTDPIPVSPGDVIDFTIEINLIGSRAIVRP